MYISTVRNATLKYLKIKMKVIIKCHSSQHVWYKKIQNQRLDSRLALLSVMLTASDE